MTTTSDYEDPYNKKRLAECEKRCARLEADLEVAHQEISALRAALQRLGERVMEHER